MNQPPLRSFRVENFKAIRDSGRFRQSTGAGKFDALQFRQVRPARA
jgi:hypothetical protein